MPGPRIGSLCSGYGGLDLGVQAVLGGSIAWHADPAPAAAAILEHHWPGVLNLGDIETVDFRTVEPVCVLVAGFPCTDVSVAGTRRGLAEGTRSGLWHTIARAISTLRPCLVVLENVRGLLSTAAHSPAADGDVEFCPWCLGETGAEHPLRALGAVLGDLALRGYDARWQVLPASAVGAPHRRERVFLTAWPADAECPGLQGPGHAPGEPGACGAAAHPHLQLGHDRGQSASGPAQGGRARPEPLGPGGAPAADPARVRQGQGRAEPAREPGRPDDVERRGEDAADTEGRRRRDAGSPRRRGLPAAAVAGGAADVGLEAGGVGRWGEYTAAIARWEYVTRPAPAPVDSRGRLTPEFVEWVMGLEEGWVTQITGLSRSAKLTALGNGVVPQQAAMAMELLTPGIPLCGNHRIP
ncbi:DNA cytosine methyltransferase [Kitasatospora sp. NA04385]|nr:DNA cytosine methyltransferase [Kitasatospora sp. NA04385]